MNVIMLLENHKTDNKLTAKHGLSLYIEHMDKRIIFDTGPDDTFIKNADKLNVDITRVDYLILSHGHVDHGGGLRAFLDHNKMGKVIVSKHAFERYYTGLFSFLKLYVGLDKRVINDRFIFVDDFLNIDGIGFIYSQVTGDILLSNMNNSLYVKTEKGYLHDHFNHEINLVFNTGNRNVLVSGCSHKGIINIMETSINQYNTYPDIILAGMHLYNPVTKKRESDDFITTLAQEIKTYHVHKYYTYHCTGKHSFSIMQDILGDRIHSVSTGDNFEI